MKSNSCASKRPTLCIKVFHAQLFKDINQTSLICTTHLIPVVFKDDSITFKFYNSVTILSLAITLVEVPLCIPAEAPLWVAQFYVHWDDAKEPKDSQGNLLSLLIFRLSLCIGFYLRDS